MITKEKPLAQRRGRLYDPRYYGTDYNLHIINASERLIDLQRPMLACLGIDMIPVVKTKGHVAVLLYFKNYNVVQGVDGSRLHQDSVARLWREVRQVVLNFPVCNSAAKIIRRGAGLQAGVDTAFGIRFQDYPRFGFSSLPRRNQFKMRIRGMDLDGQSLAYIEKLQQQRKSGKLPSQPSHELVRPLVQQFFDGFSLERPVGDEARMVVAVAQDPGFSNWAISR